MFDRDATLVYERFTAARANVVALTDTYCDMARDDPRRAETWRKVIRDTEATRQLLLKWLAMRQTENHIDGVRELALV